MAKTIDGIERDIYALICGSEGIKARDIANVLQLPRKTVNQYLFSSPFMRELCYQDRLYRWHGLIRQAIPHEGLRDFSGWYGRAGEFLELGREEFLCEPKEGCRRIGRNLVYTRVLIHAFEDARDTILALLSDLKDLSEAPAEDWELVFELRIKRARSIRIYADVLVITGSDVFSLEFKMKDAIDRLEVAQAAKYRQYLEVIFGPHYHVVPVLVLTRARDLYRHTPIPLSAGDTLPVCSGDMLFNVFDEHMKFLKA